MVFFQDRCDDQNLLFIVSSSSVLAKFTNTNGKFLTEVEWFQRICFVNMVLWFCYQSVLKFWCTLFLQDQLPCSINKIEFLTLVEGSLSIRLADIKLNATRIILVNDENQLC